MPRNKKYILVNDYSGQLSQIVTNYPWFKIKNEGIPKSLVSTNPFFQVANYLLVNINYEN